MRRYDDPVEVRRGTLAAGADTLVDERAPEQFLWRGKLWKVRAVLAHWVETGPWWSSPGVSAVIGVQDLPDDPDNPDAHADQPVPRPIGDLITERELWRVEAGRGRAVGRLGAVGPDGEPDAGGVFDLAFDWADGCWQLVGCVD